jgi:hypothetical protein
MDKVHKPVDSEWIWDVWKQGVERDICIQGAPTGGCRRPYNEHLDKDFSLPIIIKKLSP